MAEIVGDCYPVNAATGRVLYGKIEAKNEIEEKPIKKEKKYERSFI